MHACCCRGGIISPESGRVLENPSFDMDGFRRPGWDCHCSLGRSNDHPRFLSASPLRMKSFFEKKTGLTLTESKLLHEKKNKPFLYSVPAVRPSVSPSKPFLPPSASKEKKKNLVFRFEWMEKAQFGFAGPVWLRL